MYNRNEIYSNREGYHVLFDGEWRNLNGLVDCMARDSPYYKSIIEMRKRVVYNLMKGNPDINSMEIIDFRKKYFDNPPWGKYTTKGIIVGKVTRGYDKYIWEDYKTNTKYLLHTNGTISPMPHSKKPRLYW